MPNSIELIKKYAAAQLDKIFLMESVTGILENRSGIPLRPVENDAKTVYLPDLVLSGLGDYDMTDGFPMGDIALEWTPYLCEMDRGRGFQLDSVLDAESAGAAFGNLATEFMRTKVIPEVDAYRLSKLFANAAVANVKSETIAANSIIGTFNAVIETFLNNEISTENLILFISTAVDRLIKDTTELQRKVTQADYKVGDITFRLKKYEEIPFVVVPQTRFKTLYTFGTNGFTPQAAAYALTTDEAVVTGKKYYTKSGSVYTLVANPATASIATYYERTKQPAVDMNFMVVHTNAALPYKKHEKVRVFTPDQNQKADAWLFQYRLYHDLITPKNKQLGIYASIKPEA